MASAEETLNVEPRSLSQKAPIVNRALDLISSVRLGVVLLCILVVLSMIGMLILQQNVNGFDAYYTSLTPAEKIVYGRLGFFDIYHSWYFNLLLLALSLNIILASIDRFPSAWAYIREPKRTATREWLLGRQSCIEKEISAANDAEALAALRSAFERSGLEPNVSTQTSTSYGRRADGSKDFSVTETNSSTVLFAETGRWNRLGAYIVHVFLLTLFLGHYVALQTGFDADVKMIPGQVTNQIQQIEFDLDKKLQFNVVLPFEMTCTDIEQRLIDPNGAIDVSNTLDWRTALRIDDPDYGTTTANVSLNNPFTYRGFRFFQAQTIPVGNARNIELTLTPEKGGEPVKAKIDRLGSTLLADGTIVEFSDFQPDFTFGPGGKPDTRSSEYNNPVAVLSVTPPGGEKIRVFAFARALSPDLPIAAPKAGYRWQLSGFEKAPLAHVLSIKYDPFNAAFVAWYVGGFGLVGALAFVFFFSHRRFWAMITRTGDATYKILIAGDANRNRSALEDRVEALADSIDPKK